MALIGFGDGTTSEEDVRLGKLKNGKDEVTGDMTKGGGDRLVDWIWTLCNMAFESCVPEDWRPAMIVPLSKDNGERTGCSNYIGISLSVVGKIYEGILIDRVR